MAAIARIAVISAVFYLVRFALAHQHRAQSKYSDSDSTYSLQEDSGSGCDESNEKVLIKSGVPLRGRTIHQTAWSEEEKVSMPEKDTLQQPDNQNANEKLYDSWSLTNAINYILSFIYDTEVDGNVIISNNVAENSNENSNIPKNNFDKGQTHRTAIKINYPKEKSENIQMFNKGRVLEATPNYPIGNKLNQDKEWFRNEISSLSDEYTYTEYDTENSEFSNESADSEYEEESYKYEDYDVIHKDKVDEMHSLGSVINDFNVDSMRNNIAKQPAKQSVTEIRERKPESVEEDEMQGTINYDKNDGGNFYATTERTSIGNIIFENPPTASYLQIPEQSQNKELSSKSDSLTQTEKPKVFIDKNYPGKHKTVLKNSNGFTKTTVKFADRAQMNPQFKIYYTKNNKNIDYQNASIIKKKSVVPHNKPSQFPSVKPLKDQRQKYLKSKQRYLDDIYFDMEPDEDVRSYNYLLDSYEFIRIDNNNNKVNKKRDDSIYVIIQDKDHGSKIETSTILSAPFTPFQDQREVEVIDKSHESFDTILEYLYKNSNSSFILSLKEHNSSET